MTLAEVLKSKGIEFKQVEIDGFVGVTKNGTEWCMYRAYGSYGFQVTLHIGDKNITHCKLQTAIKKIING